MYVYNVYACDNGVRNWTFKLSALLIDDYVYWYVVVIFPAPSVRSM